MKPPPPVFFDASHTSHTTAHTGIQRVCRSFFAGLEETGGSTAVCFDPHLGQWRMLEAGELAVLRDRSGGKAAASRGARWTLRQKWAGQVRRLARRKPVLPPAGGLVCPEIFSTRVAAQLPALIAQAGGPCVAIFYDAIALKFPEMSPPGTVARMPAYLRELLQFDGIAAISDDSAASLRDFWHWLGAEKPPPVETIVLGLDDLPPSSGAGAKEARVLCVSTIEGRKNHLALLEAAEALWSDGVSFVLELVGMARADTANAALERIAALQRAGRPLVHHGSVPEDRLNAAYAQCTFTVYPSLIEGYGLPVLESLRHGKPCVCSAHGAVGESARGGGCVALPSVDAAGLAHAIRRLLQDPVELARYAAAARTRKFRTWRDYTGDFTAWMATLRRRA